MIDGKEFIGAKAYKDSKVCNMLTMRQLHQRYHESTGVTFSSLYPGCIAETPLFRNHNFLFRIVFPFMMKNVTKAFVTAEEAGWRLAQICTNPVYSKSGVYWGWKQGGDSYYDNFNSDDRTNAYENEPSEEVNIFHDAMTQMGIFLSMQLSNKSAVSRFKTIRRVVSSSHLRRKQLTTLPQNSDFSCCEISLPNKYI